MKHQFLLMDLAQNRLTKTEANDLVASVDLFLEKRPEWSSLRLDLIMDLTAANYRLPIDFGKLRRSDDFTLIHDIANIHGYLDRTTFRLTSCFVPRCAKKPSPEVES